ncbi:MAG: NAD(P)-binding domain-containing protein, partial [Deltaproteobacteria bacterium]|nr:NAD(P)-binding domain-containing protein [Deltaproteobacteria bacterium]
MLRDKLIGIIGTGNMGEALIKGLIQSKSSVPGNISCYDAKKNKLEYMNKTYGIRTAKTNRDLVSESEIIIYAVKPQIMAPVLKETAPFLNMDKLIISVAAGVPLVAIEQSLKKDLRL